MRRGREAARMDAAAPDSPAFLPALRRQIIVRDYDFGERVHMLDLYRTDRIDCYRVVADGVEWKGRRYDPDEWDSADEVNRCLSAATACGAAR